MEEKTMKKELGMKPAHLSIPMGILTINGGSSSIKVALFCYQVQKWIGSFPAGMEKVLR